MRKYIPCNMLLVLYRETAMKNQFISLLEYVSFHFNYTPGAFGLYNLLVMMDFIIRALYTINIQFELVYDE